MSLGHAFWDHLPETTLPRTFFCTMVWYCYRKINFSPEKEVRDVNLMPWKQAFFSFLTYGFIFRSIEGEMKISVPVANEQRSKEEMRYFSYVKAILLLIYVSLPSSAIQCYCKYFCLSSVRRWMEVVKNGLQRGKSSVSNFFPTRDSMQCTVEEMIKENQFL